MTVLRRLLDRLRPPAGESVGERGPSPAQLFGLFEPLTRAASAGTTVELRVESPARIALPSGRLVASDPWFVADAPPFTRTVAAGSYRIELLVAAYPESGDERIAAALTRFSAGVPASWELATLPGQDAGRLGPGEWFGYGVDSGTGCFTSPEGSAAFAQRHSGDRDMSSDPLLAALEATYRHTWSWADLDLGDGANLVAFTSGWGDGVYGTWWGLGADDETVCALTDFGVLDAPRSD